MAYMTDFIALSAGYVDRILKGAKPADMPVRQATKFEFIIHMKTAKALGIAIPKAVLVRAVQVIEFAVHKPPLAGLKPAVCANVPIRQAHV